jgi:hypothetical protein
MARPRAGDWLDAEIAQWKEAGVEVVVSLLECSGQLLLALCTEQTFVLRLQSKGPRRPKARAGGQAGVTNDGCARFQGSRIARRTHRAAGLVERQSLPLREPVLLQFGWISEMEGPSAGKHWSRCFCWYRIRRSKPDGQYLEWLRNMD